jgi:Fe-S oxidoreductase
VGIDPAVALTYRDEYAHLKLPALAGVKVELLQEFLARTLPTRVGTLKLPGHESASEPFRLFGHCQERTMAPKSHAAWKDVFGMLQVPVELETTGCCGMCGVFGHESEHFEESKGLFEMSWQKKLASSKGTEARSRVLATGHSCRSQVKRFEGFVPLHPAEALARVLGARLA